MKAQIPPNIEKHRVTWGPLASDASYGFNGCFVLPHDDDIVHVIISDGGGWDHVSVSLQNRCPTFQELKWIKNIFFDPEETVVHFFPKESEYVNRHATTLHLWRNQEQEHQLPPKEYVG